MAEHIATFLGEDVNPEDHIRGVKRQLEYHKKRLELQQQLEVLQAEERASQARDAARVKEKKFLQPEIEKLLEAVREAIDATVMEGTDPIHLFFKSLWPGKGKGKGKGQWGTNLYSCEQRAKIAIVVQNALRCSGYTNASFYYNEDENEYKLDLTISTCMEWTNSEEKLRTGLKGNCALCYEEGKDMFILVPCGHMTCSGCHGDFLNKACPFCRKTVTGFQGAFPN